MTQQTLSKEESWRRVAKMLGLRNVAPLQDFVAQGYVHGDEIDIFTSFFPTELQSALEHFLTETDKDGNMKYTPAEVLKLGLKGIRQLEKNQESNRFHREAAGRNRIRASHGQRHRRGGAPAS